MPEVVIDLKNRDDDLSKPFEDIKLSVGELREAFQAQRVLDREFTGLRL